MIIIIDLIIYSHFLWLKYLSDIVGEYPHLCHEDVNSNSEASSNDGKNDIAPQDFVIVKLRGKRSEIHYMAQIIREDENGDFNVKFKKKSSNNSFVFPNVDNIVHRSRYFWKVVETFIENRTLLFYWTF